MNFFLWINEYSEWSLYDRHCTKPHILLLIFLSFSICEELCLASKQNTVPLYYHVIVARITWNTIFRSLNTLYTVVTSIIITNNSTHCQLSGSKSFSEIHIFHHSIVGCKAFYHQKLTHLSRKDQRFGFFKVITVIIMCPNVDTLVAKDWIIRVKSGPMETVIFFSFLFVPWREIKQFCRCLGLCLRHQSNVVETNSQHDDSNLVWLTFGLICHPAAVLHCYSGEWECKCLC